MKSSYREWIKRRFNDIDTIKNEDYEVFSKNGINPKGGRPQAEHLAKSDTVKGMAMPGRNEKGKQNGMCILFFATMPHIIVKEGICLWTVLSAGLEERNY
ncbi:MAG: antA/AntB antirepressor family protein [Lachnospiraceae bacterium]